MMKKNLMKLLALVLCVVMVLSLFTACDLLSMLKDDDDDDDDDKVRGTISQAILEPTAAAQDPAVQATVADETPAPAEKEFNLGTTTSSTYENAFIGIGFEAPEGWTFYTDEQIRAQNQATANMLDEDYAELIANASIVYDMMVQDSATGNNVNINLEKNTAAAVAALDLEVFLDKNLDMLVDAFSGMGISITESKIVDVTLGGKATKGLWLKCNYSGIAMYELIAPIKCGSYMANVAIVTIGDDTIADIVDCFYAVN